MVRVDEPASPPVVPVTRMRDMVLLHYCFDQQAGETKKEHCFCEERADRVHRDVAEEYVKDGSADWLIVKNARAKTGTSIFRRALVVRSVVIDGERLFAVSSRWKSKRKSRDEKYEAIKAKIRNDAKSLIQKMFSRGMIAQDMFQKLQVDAELESLLTDRTKGQGFLDFLRWQERREFHTKFTEIVFHWWNNVLGYYRLDVDAGMTMKNAPAGMGLIVHAPDAGPISDQVRGNTTVAPAKLTGEDKLLSDLGLLDKPLGEGEFEDNHGRRVKTANHMRKPWDPSGGTDPRKFEDDKEPFEVEDEGGEEPFESGDKGEGGRNGPKDTD